MKMPRGIPSVISLFKESTNSSVSLYFRLIGDFDIMPASIRA